MIAIPKDERLAGYYAAVRYKCVTDTPAIEVILMVNAVLRAAQKVRDGKKAKATRAGRR